MKWQAPIDHPAFRPIDVEHLATPNVTDLAWLAGFVDGEGSIMLVRPRNQTVRTFLYLVNTDLENVLRARTIVSACLRRDVLPACGANVGRPDYKLWIARHSEMRTLLTAILPWLAGKRPQAELMLQYLRECSAMLDGRRRLRDTPELRARRHEFARRMAELNKRYAPGEWLARHASALREGRGVYLRAAA